MTHYGLLTHVMIEAALCIPRAIAAELFRSFAVNFDILRFLDCVP